MEHHPNIIHLEHSWGIFLGSFTDNRPHKHYALQLSIPLSDPVYIQAVEGTTSCTRGVFVKSHVNHRLYCQGTHLLLLISPVSAMGHLLESRYTDPVACFDNPKVEEIQEMALEYLSGKQTENEFLENLIRSLNRLEYDYPYYENKADQRIIKALQYLEQNHQRVIPLKEIAGHCFLSTSRFLHLFKENTGITYRRAQLWTRIRQSVPGLRHQNITQTAHQHGFTDSAHYCKVFQETFGLSPKQLKK